MHSFVIDGRKPLSGSITATGNKNAALPMLAATLLTEERVELSNVPGIGDVQTMSALLQDVGANVERLGAGRIAVQAREVVKTGPLPALCTSLRASFLLVAPLLARRGLAELPAPGGDRIGRRPLDTHVDAFEQFGVVVDVLPDRYVFRAPRGFHGAEIFLREMSVMATENAVMAAALARGDSVICNAASEPHVQDLCHLLVAMGASISGIGTNTLCITGRERLHGARAVVGPDHIEVGSFIALAAATGGEVTIHHARPRDQRVTAIAYGQLGVRWEERGDSIIVPAGQKLDARDGLHGATPRIHDAPWPGFPADLTSIALVLATQARGTVMIHEWMYESRLYWVDRLISMGARVIVCDPHRAVVVGPSQLYGSVISSPDIRAGMALLIAALVADGRSVIHNAQQIDRGYENIEGRLRALGASIERVDTNSLS